MRNGSAGAVMKYWLSFCLLCFVFTTPGCRSAKLNTAADNSSSPPPPANVPSSNGITFVDLPELQKGTGAMDVVPVPEFSATDSGLKYRILRNSDRKKPTADDTVSVNYRGWLNSGTVFDSSYERGEPTTFPLKNVIAGWTEGMQFVGEGGMIELWVPSRLGYGAQGTPGSIPPHSNLHFIIELVNVK